MGIPAAESILRDAAREFEDEEHAGSTSPELGGEEEQENAPRPPGCARTTSTPGGLAAAEQEHLAEWRRLAAAVPFAVRAILQRIDVPHLRLEGLEHAEADLFGWSQRTVVRRGRTCRVDTAAAGMNWQAACAGARRQETLRVVRRAANDTKNNAQLSKIQAHAVAARLAPHHENPHVVNGVLTVEPPQGRRPYFGVTTYLEATPVETIVYAVRRWESLGHAHPPHVWDLTAGGGTVEDVVRRVYLGTVVATDIVAARETECCDLRRIGEATGHRGRGSPLRGAPAPDLIFLDPPSRGSPSPSELYFGTLADLDLARLGRADFIETVGLVATWATEDVNPDGLVCLLLRHAERRQQEVTVDLPLADDVLARLPARVRIVERLAVVETHPVKQASLATSRYPMTLLLLGAMP